MNGTSPLRASLLQFVSRYDVPAVGAAIVDRDGRVVVDVVGVRERAGREAVEEHDAWHIGSCGKSMTAALYARIVERGDARWGAPVSELFDDLTIDPGWRRITIDEVLLHRAGLRANLSRSALIAGLGDRRPLREQRTEAAERALAHPPARPGRFRYSNLGYIVVGAAIERITGVAYEEALTAHVLVPVGITTAGFGPPDRLLGHGGRLAVSGLAVGRGRPAGNSDPASDNPPVMSPAGRMHVTLRDWARFQQVFLGGGGTLLSAESVERLLTPATGRPPHQAMGWAPAQLRGVSVGQQGSNTFWMATALIDDVRARTVMVVCNDGRTRLIAATARFAADVLAQRLTVPGGSAA